MDSSERLRAAIGTSVLCWLATVDADGQPNVSPKEIICTPGARRLAWHENWLHNLGV
jgi:uncharacterized protein